MEPKETASMQAEAKLVESEGKLKECEMHLKGEK
jgi:hypothetical protein